MDIKPIETEYKGYRFRSRLEARWAVFFDECGFKWEYEPEGFDIDGTKYLPDFRLKNVQTRYTSKELEDIFVEVKGDMDDESRGKIWSLSMYYPVLVVGAMPYEKDGYNYILALSKIHDSDPLFYGYDTIDGDGYPAGIFVNKQGNPALAGPDHDLDNMDEGKTFTAMRLARGARFEHGGRGV